MMAQTSKRSDYTVAFGLMLGAVLLMGLLWVMIDSNRFHLTHATQVTTPSQPASPTSSK
jgi:hypothetical protein